ncbi:unnamed protein product [Lathyrus oleraceus]
MVSMTLRLAVKWVVRRTHKDSFVAIAMVGFDHEMVRFVKTYLKQRMEHIIGSYIALIFKVLQKTLTSQIGKHDQTHHCDEPIGQSSLCMCLVY